MLPLTMILLSLAAPPNSVANLDGFNIAPISAQQRAKMLDVTWKKGCPVGIEKLREVHVRHKKPNGTDSKGILIVHASVAQETLEIFQELFAASFAIEEIRPAAFGAGNDDHLMATNTTSGFNCRRVTGGKGFSKHSYGRAIDINPLWNPYVKGKKIMPPKGRPFAVKRNKLNPQGLMLATSLPVKLFKAAGWVWGGDWKSLKDYQHVEKKK